MKDSLKPLLREPLREKIDNWSVELWVSFGSSSPSMGQKWSQENMTDMVWLQKYTSICTALGISGASWFFFFSPPTPGYIVTWHFIPSGPIGPNRMGTSKVWIFNGNIKILCLAGRIQLTDLRKCWCLISEAPKASMYDLPTQEVNNGYIANVAFLVLANERNEVNILWGWIWGGFD